MASFMENLTGTNPRVNQINRFNPQQQSLQSQLLSQVSGLLGNQQNNRFNFAPVADEARNKFHTETIPSIAERFTAMGGSGSQNSSAFQGALGNAGSGLEKGLASLQSQFGLQQQGLDQNLLQSLLGLAFQSPYENIYEQGSPGLFHTGALGAGSGIGQQIPDFLKYIAPLIGSAFGPVGTAAGAGASGLIGLLQKLLGGGGNQQSQPQNPVPAENTPGARL